MFANMLKPFADLQSNASTSHVARNLSTIEKQNVLPAAKKRDELPQPEGLVLEAHLAEHMDLTIVKLNALRKDLQLMQQTQPLCHCMP